MSKRLRFKESDKVFLKVSLVRWTLRIGQKGKLGRRYIELFENLTKI